MSWGPCAAAPPALLPVVLVVLVALLAAVAANNNESISVTVSAGPIAVMEPPTASGAPTSQQALLGADAEAVDQLGPWPGSARGRPGRDLAGLLRTAAHRLIRSIGDELRDLAEGKGPPAGRRKKGDAWPMLGAGLIMGGTLLTIGLGALAAMSGKALMSAMLALGMSLMSAFRGPPRRCRRSGDNNGCSNGDGNDNYEIIARPVITHGHTHSAVLHHDPGYAAPGYPGYVRSLVQPEQIQAVPAAATTVDVTDFARSGATRPPLADSEESGGWHGGVVGMRGPTAAHQSPTAPGDGVLSLTLGTWGQQQAKHRTRGRAEHSGAHAVPASSPATPTQD